MADSGSLEHSSLLQLPLLQELDGLPVNGDCAARFGCLGVFEHLLLAILLADAQTRTVEINIVPDQCQCLTSAQTSGNAQPNRHDPAILRLLLDLMNERQSLLLGDSRLLTLLLTHLRALDAFHGIARVAVYQLVQERFTHDLR